MVKATLRNKQTSDKTPAPIDVQSTVVSEKIESTAGIGNGSGKPEDLTSLLPDQAPGAPEEVQEPVPESRAVVSRPPQPVARFTPAPVEGFDGDWGADDVKYPRLQLVQGSGPLSSLHDVGTTLLSEVELLPPPSVKEGAVNPVLRILPVHMTKQWKEKLTQEQSQEGMIPRIVKTVDKVHELGGTITWGGGSTMPDNYWEPSSRCIFLIEQPDGNDHPGFNLELDGKFFAVAIYYAAGSAFRDSALKFYNTSRTQLLVPVLDGEGKPVVQNGRPVKKSLLYKNFWQLSFGKKSSTKSSFTWWGPNVKLLKEESGPDVRNFCADIIDGAQKQEAAEAAEEAAKAAADQADE